MQFVERCRAEARAALDQAVELVPGTTLDAALDEVRQGDVGGAVEQQGDTLVLHFSAADQVTAATVQGVFSAFVRPGEHRA